ncbi:uncharacterized protein LOC119101952 [Pollicipes pollicipes]|uniref:uncharacterized protein LOC119101952 n=1 Tax=Pollicipes pollicipes TaxID=41117 RepID=UPI001885808A|nr:uncharacterized protein LOC119101952 [Pollicipes pollicipes]
MDVYLDNRFTLAVVEYLPGKSTKDTPATADGYGDREADRFVTQKLDLNSLQRSPNWMDPPTTIHPHYDNQAALLVRLYSLPLEYKLGGRLVPRDGAEFSLSLDQPSAWTVLQLFEKKSVYCGTHAVPLLKPPVDSSFTGLAQRAGVSPKLFTMANTKGIIKPHDMASLEVTIWDGTFTSEECPPIKRFDGALSAIQPLEKYAKPKVQKAGPPVSALVFENMTDEQKQAGIAGPDYDVEKQAFEASAVRKFNTLLNKSLVADGKPAIRGIPEE